MAFWSDLGKKISDTTQSVVEKTKISTDTMRLNGLISDEERNVQRIYAEIGRKYMELHGADGDPDFAGLMQEYQTSKAKMEEYRSQIRRNKHLLICAGCGAEIPETVLYCTRCGAENPVGKRLAEEQRQREEAERAAREADLQAAAVPQTEPQPEFCARCGQPRTAGAMFCTFCGAQFVPPVAAAPAPAAPAPESPAPEAAPAPVAPEAPAPESPAPEAAPTPAAPEAPAPESPAPEAAPAPSAPEAPAPESPAPEAAPELELPPAEEKPAAPAASSEVCPKCGAARIAGNRFCVQCGAKYPETAHICPKCGKEVPGKFRFCIHCGTELPKE